MKSVRVNFEKGINNVGDKAILPDGYSTILDNVDLRSGSPRPFRAPEFQFSPPSGTTRSFQYRGRWHHSPNWRDYVAEFIGGIERVYYTEDGELAQKDIEGDVAQLGTPVPLGSLGVVKASASIPEGVIVSISNGSGTIPYGDYYYSVSAKTADGILNGSPLQKITLEKVEILENVSSYGFANTRLGRAIIVSSMEPSIHAQGLLLPGGTDAQVVQGWLQYAVDITWGPVEGAVSYIVWKGDVNSQSILTEVDASVLSYRDDGTKLTSGGLLSDYVSNQELQYAYTYVRNVGGVEDESGLSYPSTPVLGEFGRLVTRDYQNDGYFSNPLALTGTAAAVPSANSFPTVNLYAGTASFDATLSQTRFILSTTHNFLTDDKVLFPTTMTDPVYAGTEQKVIADTTDVKTFYIKNRNVPTDADPATGVFSTTIDIQPVKTKFTHLNLNVSTGDAVFITYPQLSGTLTVTNTGLYKATPYLGSTAAFTMPFITTSTIAAASPATLKWIPNNGFYKYWNLYRNEQGGWFLVKNVDIWDASYTDYKPFPALGATPTSYYSENGQVVDYRPPPKGIVGIETHYGMKFAINGHQIRWTPILQPDAWPDTFTLTMAYKPVALASFAQGLIVLCEDAVYRIDGNQPTMLSIAKTRAEDGCIAAHSVQKTQQGLIYLSKRGIMLFDGTDAICITDTRIPSSSLTGPSRLPAPIPFWWIPTTMTRNYADFAGEDGIRGQNYAFTLDNTTTIPGINNYVKSFYHLGKYFMFYTGADYEGNTAICIDLQLPGYPITTLGLKAIDATVNEVEQAFVLLGNSPALTTVTITSPV
jgi:hypothetical protein